jgi:hypothetical protein
MPYQVKVSELTALASIIGKQAASNTDADAMDRVAVAVYEVGAALTERLETLIKLLEQAKVT